MHAFFIIGCFKRQEITIPLPDLLSNINNRPTTAVILNKHSHNRYGFVALLIDRRNSAHLKSDP